METLLEAMSGLSEADLWKVKQLVAAAPTPEALRAALATVLADPSPLKDISPVPLDAMLEEGGSPLTALNNGFSDTEVAALTQMLGGGGDHGLSPVAMMDDDRADAGSLLSPTLERFVDRCCAARPGVDRRQVVAAVLEEQERLNLPYAGAVDVALDPHNAAIEEALSNLNPALRAFVQQHLQANPGVDPMLVIQQTLAQQARLVCEEMMREQQQQQQQERPPAAEAVMLPPQGPFGVRHVAPANFAPQPYGMTIG